LVFYMPGHVEARAPDAGQRTPREIVQTLDRHIVGQAAAKRAVAIALRNRTRRQQLEPALAEEVLPKNILMIGPTGVGKTEIARRLARLAGAPFLKVEASKFTEVGYVGRDVESMIRDLVEVGVEMAKVERREQVRTPAEVATRQRLLDLLLPPRVRARSIGPEQEAREREEQAAWERSRATVAQQLDAGALEERIVEIETTAPATTGLRIFTPNGMEEFGTNLREMLPGLFQGQPHKRRTTVAEAREALEREEQEKRIDPDSVARQAIANVEQAGILFIDELDKIAGREEGHGPQVSREGVQRDLLPVVEGTLVNTKYGMVRTDHILFIGAGAFHVSKPSDLIPELQGRFPIRVELEPLSGEDLIRILKEPEASLLRQYEALLGTDGVELVFRDDGVAAMAAAAERINRVTESIGARRLHTILERVLEDVSFAGPELRGERIVIDESYVKARLDSIAADADLSRYIL
jgi:ATP-dependent HslUV protease ATP-binding subunit HslU